MSCVKSSSEGIVYICNLDCMILVLKSRTLQRAVKTVTLCVLILLYKGLGHIARSFLILDEWPRRWCPFEENWQALQLHVLNCTPAACRDVPSSTPGMWSRNMKCVCNCQRKQIGYQIDQLSHCVGHTPRKKGSY